MAIFKKILDCWNKIKDWPKHIHLQWWRHNYLLIFFNVLIFLCLTLFCVRFWLDGGFTKNKRPIYFHFFFFQHWAGAHALLTLKLMLSPYWNVLWVQPKSCNACGRQKIWVFVLKCVWPTKMKWLRRCHKTYIACAVFNRSLSWSSKSQAES